MTTITPAPGATVRLADLSRTLTVEQVLDSLEELRDMLSDTTGEDWDAALGEYPPLSLNDYAARVQQGIVDFGRLLAIGALP